MTSKDGYQWTPGQGLVKGVPSIGVIQPETNLRASDNSSFDLIVVGAGYAGLTASRDATSAGLRVLLLEARDRIGGRSWSSNIDGYPFEMGGTWVSWGQPHVWREISRYQTRDQLEISQNYSYVTNEFVLQTTYGRRTMSHEEEDQLVEKSLKKFVNIDGAYGANVMPFPHTENAVPESQQYDALSVADRLEQIQHNLTPDEYTAICGFVLLCSCGTLENTSFYEFLHWWFLCGHSYKGCIEHLVKYKFRGGQSSFAINFFKEAVETRRLSYAFNTRVSAVIDGGDAVSVKTQDGKSFHAPKIICAIPLNVLKKVSFQPPLSTGKQTVISKGHVNKCAKVHAESRGSDLRSWSCINYPHNSLNYAFGDGLTPHGNTHVVAFGGSQNQLQPEKNIEETQQALQNLVPMDLERIVFHNWAEDEFAEGAWFFSSPGMITRHLQDMRACHGNVHFASADWAVGWRSFIDGAIEEGTRNAFEVIKELRQKGKQNNQRASL